MAEMNRRSRGCGYVVKCVFFAVVHISTAQERVSDCSLNSQEKCLKIIDTFRRHSAPHATTGPAAGVAGWYAVSGEWGAGVGRAYRCCRYGACTVLRQHGRRVASLTQAQDRHGPDPIVAWDGALQWADSSICRKWVSGAEYRHCWSCTAASSLSWVSELLARIQHRSTFWGHYTEQVQYSNPR